MRSLTIRACPRYSSYEVNGVLLGSRNLEQDGTTEVLAACVFLMVPCADVVRVDQAVPLFHSPTLKPMLDAAMMLVRPLFLFRFAISP